MIKINRPPLGLGFIGLVLGVLIGLLVASQDISDGRSRSSVFLRETGVVHYGNEIIYYVPYSDERKENVFSSLELGALYGISKTNNRPVKINLR